MSELLTPGAWATYRLRTYLADAFQYRGEFPLEFLRDGEEVRVRPGSNGSGMIEITQHGCSILAKVGEWIVRYPDGHIRALADRRFRRKYEVVHALSFSRQGGNAR